MAVAQRLDRSLDDEIGRAEIRLADAEIDDVAALRGQRIGARQHRKGILLADTVEGRDGAKHGVSRFASAFVFLVVLAHRRSSRVTRTSAMRMTSKMIATDQPISSRPLSAVSGP